MDLSATERLLLSNQFRILALLDPKESASYERAQEIVDRGYKHMYSEIAQGISPEVSEAVGTEVFDILDMHRALDTSYRSLDDKAGLKEQDVKFRGFDGNNESDHFGYASFLIEKNGRWEESKGNINSHYPILDRYREMLRRWRELGGGYELTKEEIERIIAR